MEQEILNALNWRYAVKKFLDKKVDNDKLGVIKESIRLSPSSYGLQPYRVEILEDKEALSKLQSFSFNQTQIGTASHLFVFIVNKNIMSRIEEFGVKMIENGADTESASKTVAFVNNVFSDKGEEFIKGWSYNQAYIALGMMMNTLAMLKIDSCAMEGFDKNEYNKYFDLNIQEEEVAVVIPIGYRADEPKFKKLRFNLFNK